MRRLPLILVVLMLVAAADVGFDPRVGARLPTTTVLADDDGRILSLGEAQAGRPAIVALVYYRCPNLCGFVLRDLTAAIDKARLDPAAYSLLVRTARPSTRMRSPAQAAMPFNG